MKIARSLTATALTAGLVLALGACSSDDSRSGDATTDVTQDDATGTGTTDDATEETTGEDEELSDSSDDASSDDDVTGNAPEDFGVQGATSEEIKTSCESFNTIVSDLRAVEPGDTDAYDDIYLRAEDEKDTAPTETYGLFAVLSLLALEAGSGGTEDETMSTMMDAITYSAGACTAEDVTLTF
ncbi:hypothetical protein [Sanguibacter inulinus]|uniref:Lipoprotein n=1 Tax=Sanguibacter inulinus TaxID=60922 RepID=A0A853EQJ7_9MICO|nr:hypothetical protein [Sanguibacter inulinus]MBF0721656.1 hypothetical protein [Sanguibacter inulinus]NYS92801.1 hypothetical protein [Sanguibacter inulinus]